MAVKKLQIFKMIVFGCSLVIVSYFSLNSAIFKPWKKYGGEVCNWTGCYTSAVNQKYDYWKSLAVERRNPSLCQRVVGYDGGDLHTDKENAIEMCIYGYAIETRDLEICRSINSEYFLSLCLEKLGGSNLELPN